MDFNPLDRSSTESTMPRKGTTSVSTSKKSHFPRIITPTACPDSLITRQEVTTPPVRREAGAKGSPSAVPGVRSTITNDHELCSAGSPGLSQESRHTTGTVVTISSSSVPCDLSIPSPRSDSLRLGTSHPIMIELMYCLVISPLTVMYCLMCMALCVC